jgi:hypothetical protein
VALSILADRCWDVIKKILKHLGLWEVNPRPPPKATHPPKMAEYSIDRSVSQLRILGKNTYIDAQESDQLLFGKE